jgi:hypothetical protein
MVGIETTMIMRAYKAETNPDTDDDKPDGAPPESRIEREEFVADINSVFAGL